MEHSQPLQSQQMEKLSVLHAFQSVQPALLQQLALLPQIKSKELTEMLLQILSFAQDLLGLDHLMDTTKKKIIVNCALRGAKVVLLTTMYAIPAEQVGTWM